MNEHVNYKVKETTGITGLVRKLLWFCAGADKEILKFTNYYDHMKYLGIGGVVLSTAFLAVLSMGFAMHTVFAEPDANGDLQGNWFITVSIAIAWGLIIFNLDRFIVTSTGKGDGTEKITGPEILGALPRLAMAVLIGFCISAPLETYIFDKEIQREWKLSMDQLALSKKYEVIQTENDHNKELNEKVVVLEKDAKAQQLIVDKWATAFEEEASGMRGGRGIGPEARAMKSQLDEATAKLNSIESERDSLRNIQRQNENLIKSKIDSVMNETKNSQMGFLDKIMMIERLSANGKSVPKFDPATNTIIQGQEIEIYGSATGPIWLVRLLFMILEIAPVILKLMLVRSAYDYMQDNVQEIVLAKQGVFVEVVKDENEKIHYRQKNYNPQRIVSIVEHQNKLEEENSKHALNVFAEREKKDIDQNVDNYVKPQNNTEEGEA